MTLSTIKFTCCFLIMSTFLFLSNSIHADQFLTKSNILKSTHIKIFVGENQKDAIVFHDSDIEHVKHSDLYVLTFSGSYSLNGKLSTMDLLNECGDPIPGIGFNKKGLGGFLIAAGRNIDKIIKFYPSQTIQNKSPKDIKTCLKKIPKEQKNIVEYTSNGLKGVIQQMRWKGNLTKDDIEKQCVSFAKWNVKIDSSKKYKDLYENCLSGDTWHCKDEERVVINLYDSNQCLEITNSSIDCDGKTGIGIDLREFLGVLIMEYKSNKEIWLLWDAPGYEGDGIYAIEIKDILKKKRVFEEWLVYNGC